MGTMGILVSLLIWIPYLPLLAATLFQILVQQHCNTVRCTGHAAHMQWFVGLHCCVEEVVIIILQQLVNRSGVGSDIVSPIAQRALRELRLLVAEHQIDILGIHIVCIA